MAKRKNTIETALVLMDRVKRIAGKLRNLSRNLNTEARDIEGIADAIPGAIVDELEPESLSDVRRLPALFHYHGVKFLIDSVDNDLEVEEDAPEHFCTDWYAGLVTRKITKEIIADESLIGAWDIIRWLDERYWEQEPHVCENCRAEQSKAEEKDVVQ